MRLLGASLDRHQRGQDYAECDVPHTSLSGTCVHLSTARWVAPGAIYVGEVAMIQNIAAKCIATLSVIMAVAGSPALGAGDATFGQTPTFDSNVDFSLNVSQDKKAFTITFSNLAVSIDGKSSAPIVTRLFSFVLPLSGADPGLEIPFFVSGAVLAEKGANGHLVFSVNDQTTVADYAGNSDTDFIQQLKYKVGSAPEVRITVFLLADRDSTSNSAVHLNVLAIDTDILKHQR
jgi:hypothetical protein